MANSHFNFKQFSVQQDACAMKVTTDACLFGAWCAHKIALQNSGGKKVLDIGTGTGLLSLMLAQKNAVAIEAVEIDARAAAQAHQNVGASPWYHTISVLEGDILHMEMSKSYDFIISNPPFYQTDLKSPNPQRNAAHHSQQLTVAALCRVIAAALHPDGTFFLLLPYKRRSEATALLNSHQLFIREEILLRPTPAHAPFRIMLEGSRNASARNTSELIIATQPQQYTQAFTNLLQDYYLKL